jgi:hypothetical protein
MTIGNSAAGSSLARRCRLEISLCKAAAAVDVQWAASGPLCLLCALSMALGRPPLCLPACLPACLLACLLVPMRGLVYDGGCEKCPCRTGEPGDVTYDCLSHRCRVEPSERQDKTGTQAGHTIRTASDTPVVDAAAAVAAAVGAAAAAVEDRRDNRESQHTQGYVADRREGSERESAETSGGGREFEGETSCCRAVDAFPEPLSALSTLGSDCSLALLVGCTLILSISKELSRCCRCKVGRHCRVVPLRSVRFTLAPPLCATTSAKARPISKQQAYILRYIIYYSNKQCPRDQRAARKAD